ncbi:MAG: hypothetical protein AAB588_04345 [Patescibacteria group bacterium]
MCLEKASPFVRMIFGALGGALLGIFSGLFLGLLIAWLAGGIGSGMMGSRAMMGFYVPAKFLGMGAGAIVGAILGAIYANKK